MGADSRQKPTEITDQLSRRYNHVPITILANCVGSTSTRAIPAAQSLGRRRLRRRPLRIAIGTRTRSSTHDQIAIEACTIGFANVPSTSRTMNDISTDERVYRGTQERSPPSSVHVAQDSSRECRDRAATIWTRAHSARRSATRDGEVSSSGCAPLYEYSAGNACRRGN